MKTADDLVREIAKVVKQVKGAYVYDGACSVQYCFPLKNGGELRVSAIDADIEDSDGEWHVDIYDGLLPPGITGPAVISK